jgi:hypothetical protein
MIDEKTSTLPIYIERAERLLENAGLPRKTRKTLTRLLPRVKVVTLDKPVEWHQVGLLMGFVGNVGRGEAELRDKEGIK